MGGFQPTGGGSRVGQGMRRVWPCSTSSSSIRCERRWLTCLVLVRSAYRELRSLGVSPQSLAAVLPRSLSSTGGLSCGSNEPDGPANGAPAHRGLRASEGRKVACVASPSSPESRKVDPLPFDARSTALTLPDLRDTRAGSWTTGASMDCGSLRSGTAAIACTICTMLPSRQGPPLSGTAMVP